MKFYLFGLTQRLTQALDRRRLRYGGSTSIDRARVIDLFRLRIVLQFLSILDLLPTQVKTDPSFFLFSVESELCLLSYSIREDTSTVLIVSYLP